MIYEFKARTLEFARVSREPFTYISREEYRELPKCVGTSESKICCGLDERGLAYYELREEKWTEYPELEGDREEKWTKYPELEGDCKEKWTEYPKPEGDKDEENIRYAGVCYKPSLTARVHL